ncbi:MAG: 50S ribosomal protein L13 [Candidatus Dojkabacteria bacterium]|uniref:Large ribosomal subunit protein uL13 n=1 Tax=Candidatus Dojkabacteria bacterium TaxID=2099670 RepID=A0A952DRU9_9BACT|nr:50S ribosomal protein L13 [Candidatus Dojkabacteria bacterium]WKZ27884.1 MAG: 50S ribosomal protein L13 [Candidatus Dojkabacteria bacterium]
MNHTRSIKKSEVSQAWFLVDAKGVRLGKLASETAKLLLGKHKVTRAENMITGDAVVVINASEVDVHTRKLSQKKYYKHSGYIGGLKEESLEELLKTNPTRVIETAIKGMLPKTKLGRAIAKNLYVYAGDEHKHEAQQPSKLEIK